MDPDLEIPGDGRSPLFVSDEAIWTLLVLTKFERMRVESEKMPPFTEFLYKITFVLNFKDYNFDFINFLCKDL